MEPKFERGYMKTPLHGQHDSDRVYIERIQATIANVDIKNWRSGRESEVFDSWQ